jgi:hypothetical protein
MQISYVLYSTLVWSMVRSEVSGDGLLLAANFERVVEQASEKLEQFVLFKTDVGSRQFLTMKRLKVTFPSLDCPKAIDIRDVTRRAYFAKNDTHMRDVISEMPETLDCLIGALHGFVRQVPPNELEHHCQEAAMLMDDMFELEIAMYRFVLASSSEPSFSEHITMLQSVAIEVFVEIDLLLPELPIVDPKLASSLLAIRGFYKAVRPDR